MMTLVVKYDPITREIEVVENDFSTFELFGVLTAVQHMAANDWFAKPEGAVIEL